MQIDWQMVGALGQTTTAALAVVISVLVYRFTKRQSALNLINENNHLANQVNDIVISHPEAAHVLARHRKPVVGMPDDAIILMYLNYLHNVHRMYRFGAVSLGLYRSALSSGRALFVGVGEPALRKLLGRGYEPEFINDVVRLSASSEA